MHKDIELQPASLDIWDKKYRLKTQQGVPVDGAVEDTYKRVAKALAENEVDKNKWYKEFLFALHHGAIPAGRITANAGSGEYKPSTSTINCTTSGVIGDSIEDILAKNYEAGLTLHGGCGIGYEFSTLRPKGAIVAGVGAHTSGPLTFADIYDKMCFTISSAGGRRGAQMMTFDIRHPDIEDFITAKRQDGRLRQFNLSALITKGFMEAVEAKGDWKLVFPLHYKEKDLIGTDEVVWEDSWPLKDDSYTYDEDGKVACKVYKTIKAQNLWDLIMKSTYDFAEPGFIMIDEINRLNNNWFCEEIRATNPCQPDFANVLTPEGIKQFKDISVGSTIWSGQQWTKVTRKWHTGVKPVHKYTTTRGSFVGTENHRVVEHGAKVEVKDATAIDSNKGPVDSGYKLQLNDVMDGLVIGDGSVHVASNNKVYLCIGENDKDYFDTDINMLINKNLGIKWDIAYDVDTTIRADELPLTYERKIPDRFYFGNTPTKLGFLRGLYSANGSVVADGMRVTLKGSSRVLIEQVQQMLSSVGIASYVTTNKPKSVIFENGTYDCRESYDLNITTDRDLFANMIGFIQRYKNDKISMKQTKNRSITSDIKDTEYLGDFDVYDITVEADEHTYWTGGCLVSNCGEQPLPPYGACLLGSINLTKFVKNPFYDDASFDYELYTKVIRIFTRMLDNVVEINGLPLEKQREEIIRKRRHGMGYLGLGSALTMMRIKYGSKESVEFTDEITKLLAITGFEEGIELAKEKGAAPIMSEWFEEHGKSGKELWMKSEYMKRIWFVRPDLQDAAKEHGCRFTHHSSIAPTGTIALSLGNNASNGIEPSFAHEYARNIIREGKKTKEQVIVRSYEKLLYVYEFGEDAVLPDYFVDTNSILPKEHVGIQAAAQYWIDSSISKTINVPTDYPFEDFKGIYLYAYEQGLKGCTTFRYNPEAFSGILVKEEDLANTTYIFKTEDGKEIEVTGNEDIMYDGEHHKAANLFDALKENVYGKY